MAQMSVYYIPDNQEEYFSKQEEIADRFWKIGVFLHTPNQHIYDRMKEYKNNGLPLPKWNHGFSYSGMGIADEGFEVCIPTEVCDVTCPKCSGEISEEFMICVEDEEESISLSYRKLVCPHCHESIKAADACSSTTDFRFTRVYLWVSDISDEDWEPSFKSTVESILGPCREIVSWET